LFAVGWWGNMISGDILCTRGEQSTGIGFVRYNNSYPCRQPSFLNRSENRNEV